jgi:hypothetical protein
MSRSSAGLADAGPHDGRRPSSAEESDVGPRRQPRSSLRAQARCAARRSGHPRRRWADHRGADAAFRSIAASATAGPAAELTDLRRECSRNAAPTAVENLRRSRMPERRRGRPGSRIELTKSALGRATGAILFFGKTSGAARRRSVAAAGPDRRDPGVYRSAIELLGALLVGPSGHRVPARLARSAASGNV